jgi:phospholipid N-methyltransferase
MINKTIRNADFVLRFLRVPSQIGAISPSSSSLSEAIKQGLQVIQNFSSNSDVVELGAGTGGLTRCLEYTNFTAVEIDHVFCEHLRKRFPEKKIINASAISYLQKLENPCYLISSIPLIRNPMAEEFKETIKAGYSAGLILGLATYTYGYKSPFKNCGFSDEIKFRTVLRNLPPAQVWIYR